MSPLYYILVLAILAGSFFTATNYALIDYSRSRLLDLLKGRGRENRVDQLADMQDGLLLLTSLLRTILNFIIFIAVLSIISPPEQPGTWWDVGLAFLITAILIAIFGVAIPLSWSRHAAEPLLAAALPLLRVLYLSFLPVLTTLHLFDPLVRRLLGVPSAADDDRPVEQEILDAVTEGEIEGLVDEQQKEMIEAVVEFPSITVEQIMTPRTDVEGVELTSTIDDIKKFVAETGHSRVPVYDGDLDHIVGILYVKDLIPLLGSGVMDNLDLRTLVRDALFVPESKTLRDLLKQFKTTKVHMAIVIDEYGGTAGLVTIEDVVEEIVGDIQDEYEKITETPEIQKLDENTYEITGRARVVDVNDELKIQLPESEDYDTLGGFVFATLGRIPTSGDAFDYDGLHLTVTEAEKTRVVTVKLELPVRSDADVAESAETE